jgi:DNA-binding response OmpR family regulator
VEAGFALFQEFASDLVLTDWAPGLDGLKFLALVRGSAHSRDIFAPVVIVSAFAELTHVVKARDAGVNEFLAKPFSAKLIYLRIKSIIENPRLFVRASRYFGPDRRRRRIEHGGPERRHHANRAGVERRRQALPFRGGERRQAHAGFRSSERRSDSRPESAAADGPGAAVSR